MRRFSRFLCSTTVGTALAVVACGQYDRTAHSVKSAPAASRPERPPAVGPSREELLADVQMKLGRLHFERGQWDEAASLFSEAADHPTRSLQAQYFAAWSLYSGGKLSQAEAGFQRIVDCAFPADIDCSLLAKEAKTQLESIVADRRESETTPPKFKKGQKPSTFFIVQTLEWPFPSLSALSVSKEQARLLRDYRRHLNNVKREWRWLRHQPSAARKRGQARLATLEKTLKRARTRLTAALPKEADSVGMALLLIHLRRAEMKALLDSIMVHVDSAGAEDLAEERFEKKLAALRRQSADIGIAALQLGPSPWKEVRLHYELAMTAFADEPYRFEMHLRSALKLLMAGASATSSP